MLFRNKELQNLKFELFKARMELIQLQKKATLEALRLYKESVKNVNRSNTDNECNDDNRDSN